MIKRDLHFLGPVFLASHPLRCRIEAKLYVLTSVDFATYSNNPSVLGERIKHSLCYVPPPFFLAIFI